jgi:ABC-2 type transport system permease protein
MSSSQILWLVTRREVVERARSKAFIFGSLFTVLLLMAAVGFPFLLDGGAESYDVGVVGHNNDAVIAAALELGNADVEEGDEDAGVDIFTTPFESVAAAETALEDETIDIALVDGAELITPAGSGLGGSDVESLLQRGAAAVRLDDASGEVARAAEILSEDALEVRSLGDVTGDNEAQARFLVAFGGAMLMYMAILSYGTWTLSGVTEEKTNRVVEVLLSTVQPWQLLAGKILGIGLLGLGQFVFTIAVALGAIRVTEVVELPTIPASTVPLLLLWFVLGFALYSVGMGAAGALVSRMEDAQSVAAPFTVMSIVGFFGSIMVANDPGGIVARVMTYFPPTAPFVAPVRNAFGAITWWEMGLSIALTMAAIVALVRLGGRVYSGGLLKFGTKVKWTEAFRSAEV